MTIRVVQWSTGNVGRHAIAGITPVPSSSSSASGCRARRRPARTPGELAGLGRDVGVAATTDADALLALQAGLHRAHRDGRQPAARGDRATCERFLRAGINVVSSGPVFLQYPDGVVPAEMTDPMRKAAAEGGASLWVNGVDPGFANDWLPLVLTSVSERIDEVRCIELLDYSTYDSADGACST